MHDSQLGVIYDEHGPVAPAWPGEADHAPLVRRSGSCPGPDEILHVSPPAPRVFGSGAIRDTEAGKIDFEGFLSPAVLECFGRYMDFHRNMPDGSRRSSDNWQKGFPQEVLVKSAWRHFFSLWRWHRMNSGHDECVRPFQDPLEDACGILFNVMAFIQGELKNDPEAMNRMLKVMGQKREAASRVG